MNAPLTQTDWLAANQGVLALELERVRAMVANDSFEHQELEQARQELADPAIDHLADRFALSEFERDLLLLCAGVELDQELRSKYRELCPPDAPGPTFAMALATLPGAHWSALTPAAPLRFWRLVDLGPGTELTSRQLRIDERILHFLLGASYLDARLQPLLEHLVDVEELAPSHQQIAQQAMSLWQSSGQLPIVELLGTDRDVQKSIAAMVCSELGVPLLRIDASRIPDNREELDQLSVLWRREALLTGAALLVDCHIDEPGKNEAQTRRLVTWLSKANGPTFVARREPLHQTELTTVPLDVQPPLPGEMQQIWQTALGPPALSLNGEMDRVISQFGLTVGAIRSTGERVRRVHELDQGPVGPVLWRACLDQARPNLDGLADRIESLAVWDDLVLPDAQLSTLHEISLHLAQRHRVYQEWGFEQRSNRGLGFSSLFSGDSGTGKTMAAEVLATDQGIDLYRIDLSQIVSKYVGETEKNLDRVFEAAEQGGAILLFDEADALFGKRSEVRNSHDRYANVEVSYLLQRMETYRGLAILTTNQRSALDQAFLRRLRFFVDFPFPSQDDRERIWQRIFPVDTPLEDINFAILARLSLSGGNIRNVAMHSAFLAADKGTAVGMEHLLEAARAEYRKLDKPFPDKEVRARSRSRR